MQIVYAFFHTSPRVYFAVNFRFMNNCRNTKDCGFYYAWFASSLLNPSSFESLGSVILYDDPDRDPDLEFRGSVILYDDPDRDPDLEFRGSVILYDDPDRDPDLGFRGSVILYDDPDRDPDLEFRGSVILYDDPDRDPDLEFRGSVILYDDQDRDPDLEFRGSVILYDDPGRDPDAYVIRTWTQKCVRMKTCLMMSRVLHSERESAMSISDCLCYICGDFV